MRIGYDHKTESLKRKVSIPYYIDYAGMEATPLVGHYPETQQVVWCYTKKDLLKQALNE